MADAFQSHRFALDSRSSGRLRTSISKGVRKGINDDGGRTELYSSSGKYGRSVWVLSRDRDGRWRAFYIYHEVVFAAEFSSVSRGGAGFLYPGGGHAGPSRLAQLQSIWSCSRSLCGGADAPLATARQPDSHAVDASTSHRFQNQFLR